MSPSHHKNDNGSWRIFVEPVHVFIHNCKGGLVLVYPILNRKSLGLGKTIPKHQAHQIRAMKALKTRPQANYIFQVLCTGSLIFPVSSYILSMENSRNRPPMYMSIQSYKDDWTKKKMKNSKRSL